jgi:GT2 family glycosyltransferase
MLRRERVTGFDRALRPAASAPDAISVVVCAYDSERFGQLEHALHSLCAQTLLPREIILVIDHNRELADAARSWFPEANVVENQGPPGLSAARNAGVAASSSPVIAFIDDDAVAEPSWLARLLAAYSGGDVLGVGGRIDPIWEYGRPRWFPTEFDWVVGCSYRGLPEQRQEVRNLIGANMSARRSVFIEVGGFRSDLGRRGANASGTEETELCIRATQKIPGGRWLYEPGARVQHHIGGARGTLRYLLRRCHAEGLSKAGVARAVGAQDGLVSERSYVLRTLPSGIVKNLARTPAEPAALARAVVIVAGLAATVLGYVRGQLRYRASG